MAKTAQEPGTGGADAGAARLPPDTRPGRVHLQVADVGRSVAYYEDVVGLRAVQRADGRASLAPAGGGAALLELHGRPGAARVPRQGHLGLFHFALLLPDRTALGSLVKHLAAAGEPLAASDHGVSEALYLQDPDGLGVEIYADRPASTWRRRGGELVMGTDPLDLAEVARAGETRWTGLPPGTTVGHLHLRVGELDAAAAFYHRSLGLEPTVRSYPGALFLAAGGYHHHLGLNTWSSGAVPPGAGDARLLEWELLLPSAAEVETVAGRMEAAGHPVQRSSDGALVRDPWGTPLRVRAGSAAR